MQSKEFSRFVMAAVLGQSRLDARDSSTSAKSILGSNISPELSARWLQHWDSGFVSFLSGKIRRDSFETTSTTQKFSRPNPTLLDFAAGMQVYKSEKMQMDLSLGYEQTPFIRGVSATEFALDAVSIPKAQARVQIPLKESKTFLITTEFGAKYLAAVKESDYKVKSGYGYNIGIHIEHKREKNPFFGGVQFSQNKQDSSIASQSYTNVGLVFGFIFDVLGND